MIVLDVMLDGVVAGELNYFPELNTFAFQYAPGWKKLRSRYPLSPTLPIDPESAQATAHHSAQVRFFFENLLPEGQALDDAAAANKVSKSNLIGLMSALGRETAGAVAVRIRGEGALAALEIPAMSPDLETSALRSLTWQELAARIAARPEQPFSLWDGKVRLSIAGFQDKIAVLKEQGAWFMVDAGPKASTVILKPEPVSKRLAGLTTNEFFCMRLAKAVGLPVADVRLVSVPDPVLEIERFDRVAMDGRIRRRHVIDGCQVLGISPGMKYERPYGDNKDVRNIRDGASLARLFGILDACPNPAAQRLQLLRWTLFQVLIGNMDAHAKNISFFNDEDGLRLAPSYDLVSTLSFAREAIADSLAMAIGDAFKEPEISPYEWANFAQACGIRQKLLVQQLKLMTTKVVQNLAMVASDVIEEAGRPEIVAHICEVIGVITERHAAMVDKIAEVDPGCFESSTTPP